MLYRFIIQNVHNALVVGTVFNKWTDGWEEVELIWFKGNQYDYF